MGLKDYVAQRAEIKTSSTTLSVRGLTLPDVSRLIVLHLNGIEATYARFQEIKKQVFSRSASDQFFIQAMMDFPEMIAEVISIGCDEPDELELAAKLPVGVQLECLHKIVTLTFEEAGGLKNLFASLITGLRGALPESALIRLASLTQLPELISNSSIGG